MTRKEQAMAYFSEGYNCAQAVVLAFADLLPQDKDTLAQMSSSFGGGLGRLREVCGSVSGMAMVAGALYGCSDPSDHDAKAQHYARIQELAHVFEEQNGSIVCRELLGLTKQHDSPEPEKRTPDYYQKRPCKELVGMAADIMDAYIAAYPVNR